MNRGKITRLAIVIVFISFLLSTFVSLWSLRHMAQRNMEEFSKALAARIYDTIVGELSEPTTVAMTMANDRLLTDLLSQESDTDAAAFEARIADYLSGIREGMNCEAAFLISESSRNYYSFAGLNKRLQTETDAYDRWYTSFVDSGKPYNLDVDRDELGRDAWTVFVDARIEDGEHHLLGVCGVGKRMTGNQALFRELEDEYNVRIHLIDEQGLVQVDTDETAIEQNVLSGIRKSRSDDYVYQKTDDTHSTITKYIEKLNWYLVVETDGQNERNQFMNVILLNVGLFLGMMMILILAVRIIAVRARALTDASFRDQFTGLLNRRAFEEDKAGMEQSGIGPDCVYAIVDVNGLKTANDTLGHEAGDELIRGAAECLKSCFSAYGKIYRIGGDEFAMILNMTEEQLNRVTRTFEETVQGWTGEKNDHLSVSTGYASRREFPSETIVELSRIADERMYAAKEEHYRRTGKQRRTT